MNEENSNNTSRVLHCVHCGNKTDMKQVATHKYVHNEYHEFNPMEGPQCVGTHIKEWMLYLCPVCIEVTLILEDYNDYGDPESEETQLYPRGDLDLVGVPLVIANAFQSAIQCRHLDGAICAIALRRTLEMICKAHGETKGTLGPKLKKLSEKGVLPAGISDLAETLKSIGDEAAHGDDMDFPEEIIDPLIEFTKIIIDYLYVIPRKLKTVQEDIKNRGNMVSF